MSVFILFLRTLFLRMRLRFFPSKAQVFWGQALINQGGLWAKMGQVFSQGRKKDSPPPSMSTHEARKLFLQDFPDQDILFEDKITSASMGQVFYVQIQKRSYVLKMLHPYLRESFQKEISQILLLGKLYSKLKGFRFQSNNFQRLLEETLVIETDLEREAAYQNKFKVFFEGHPFIKIPQIENQFSNKTFLCQERVDCVLAENLTGLSHFRPFEFFFRSLFVLGVLYSDLNDRNWGEQADQQTVIYDFGPTISITPRRRRGLLKLLRGEGTLTAFSEFGMRVEASAFAKRTQELRDLLFAPFDQNNYGPELENYSDFLKRQLGPEVLALRELTDPWILLLVRGLYSLIKTYHRMGIKIPLKDIVTPYLGLEATGASLLRIQVQVIEAGAIKVQLDLPLSSLDELKDSMPQHVLEKVSVKEVIQKAKDSGLVAQELFCHEVNDKSYRVWIGER